MCKAGPSLIEQYTWVLPTRPVDLFFPTATRIDRFFQPAPLTNGTCTPAYSLLCLPALFQNQPLQLASRGPRQAA